MPSKINDIFLTKKLGVKPENVRLLKTAYSSFFVTGMISTLLGAIQPNLKDAYNISYLLTGSAYSFHQVGNLAAVLMSGFLPYVIGRRKSTVMLFSCLALGIIMITISGTPALILVAFTLTGIGRGTASNITNVIVADSTENKTAGLNILHAVFALGALISPLSRLLSKFLKIGAAVYAVVSCCRCMYCPCFFCLIADV